MATQQNARELLQRLASDDAFRAKMESNPVAAFGEYGFEMDPETTPETVTLPSKEAIAKGIDLLAKQMEASNGWVVFCR